MVTMSTTFDESKVNRESGRFANKDAGLSDAGQVIQDELDFGDFEPERLDREVNEGDDRDITTDEYGVQHWPDGAQQEPMF